MSVAGWTTAREPATRNRTPNPQHAKNPEGASTEVCALSGFSLLPELQDPEGSGLPVGAQHHLSVVPAPTVSCLTAGPNNVKPTHPHRNPKRRFVFATTNLNFATTPNNQHHTNRHRPNKPRNRTSTKPLARGDPRVGGSSRYPSRPQTRETPRERPPKHPPSRGSLPAGTPDPRRAGLPVRNRSHFSVAAGPLLELPPQRQLKRTANVRRGQHHRRI